MLGENVSYIFQQIIVSLKHAMIRQVTTN